MTAPPAVPPGPAAAIAAGRLICARCRRDQPAGPWVSASCLYCAGPLLRLQWRAVPPSGVPDTALHPAAARIAYAGPPSYAGRPPRWGFPSVVWRPAEVAVSAGPTGAAGSAVPGRLPILLRLAGGAAMLLAVTALLAAAAETWRFRLLLAGRTQVLPAGPVRTSNALVAVAGWLMVGVAVGLAVVAVPALVRAAAALATRQGWAPARPAAAVVSRLVLPVVNLWGAGTVLGEISALAALPPTGGDPGPPRVPARLRPTRLSPTRIASAWWVMWVLGGVLAVAALVRGFGRSDQAVADAVELHIAIDLVAAVLAVLSAVLFARVRHALQPTADPLAGWSVAAPEPTSARGRRSAEPPD